MVRTQYNRHLHKSREDNVIVGSRKKKAGELPISESVDDSSSKLYGVSYTGPSIRTYASQHIFKI